MALAQGRAPGVPDPVEDWGKGKYPVLRCDAEGYVLVRPRAITDEMVARAVIAFFRGPRPEYNDDMRRALEAATADV